MSDVDLDLTSLRSMDRRTVLAATSDGERRSLVRVPLRDADAFVSDPQLPAGYGWCEAIVLAPTDGAGTRRCYTKARFEREGRAVCGLHNNARRCHWGPSGE